MRRRREEEDEEKGGRRGKKEGLTACYIVNQFLMSRKE